MRLAGTLEGQDTHSRHSSQYCHVVNQQSSPSAVRALLCRASHHYISHRQSESSTLGHKQTNNFLGRHLPTCLAPLRRERDTRATSLASNAFHKRTPFMRSDAEPCNIPGYCYCNNSLVSLCGLRAHQAFLKLFLVHTSSRITVDIVTVMKRGRRNLFDVFARKERCAGSPSTST